MSTRYRYRLPKQGARSTVKASLDEAENISESSVDSDVFLRLNEQGSHALGTDVTQSSIVRDDEIDGLRDDWKRGISLGSPSIWPRSDASQRSRLNLETSFISVEEKNMSSSVQPIPKGRASLIPHIVCAGAAEAIEFYKKAFDAKELSRMSSPDGRLMHAELEIGGSVVFLADDFPEYCNGKSESPLSLKGTPVTLHRYVSDCDVAIAQAEKAGATVLMHPENMFWGDRYGVIVDPFGHKWSLATHQQDLTPEQVRAGMFEAFAQAPQAPAST